MSVTANNMLVGFYFLLNLCASFQIRTKIYSASVESIFPKPSVTAEHSSLFTMSTLEHAHSLSVYNLEDKLLGRDLKYLCIVIPF